MLETRTLQVDTTIELKDLFHAWVDNSKKRIIAACLVIAAMIAAFLYFFILIGEERILLQLSPLFIGLPIVALAGQFLRTHASLRKYIKSLPESERDVHYIFHEAGDGFDVMRGKNFSHIAWETVRKVIERPRYFQFVLSQYESIIIPKRFLLHGSAEQLLKEILVSNVGHKAKLLS
jgi:hypothetical protein